MTYSIKSKNQKFQIQVGDVISDAGATGIIYSIKDNEAVVYKEYRQELLKGAAKNRIFSKLEHFIKHHPSKDLEAEEVIGSTIHQLAWPKTMVYKNGKPSGFIMDKIDFDNSVQLNMLFNIKNRNKHKITEDISWRLYVAENLARVYSELHNSNYFVIDTKPANIRAYKSVPGVALLDCDGFKLEGTSFDGEHLTRDYIAPESIGVPPQELGREQDVFALSVLLFQIFNNGIHPFSGKLKITNELDIQERIKSGSYPYGSKTDKIQEPSPFSLHHLFPTKLLSCFDDIFAKNSRPEAEELAQLFADLKKNKSLGLCSIGKHGKSFKKGCTTCAHEKLLKPKASNTQIPKSQGSNSNEPSESLEKFNQVAATGAKQKTGNGAFVLGLISMLAILGLIALANIKNTSDPVYVQQNANVTSNSQPSATSANFIELPSFEGMKKKGNKCYYSAIVNKHGIRKYGVYTGKKDGNSKHLLFFDVYETSKIYNAAKNSSNSSQNRFIFNVKFDGGKYFKQSFLLDKSYFENGSVKMFVSDYTFLMPHIRKAYWMRVKVDDTVINVPLKGSAVIASKLEKCRNNR